MTSITTRSLQRDRSSDPTHRNEVCGPVLHFIEARTHPKGLLLGGPRMDGLNWRRMGRSSRSRASGLGCPRIKTIIYLFFYFNPSL